jgi:hypothetical protein
VWGTSSIPYPGHLKKRKKAAAEIAALPIPPWTTDDGHPITNVALAEQPAAQLANASGLLNLMRNVGGAVGIGLVDTIVNVRPAAIASELVSGLTHGSRRIAESAWRLSESPRWSFTPHGAAGPRVVACTLRIVNHAQRLHGQERHLRSGHSGLLSGPTPTRTRKTTPPLTALSARAR